MKNLAKQQEVDKDIQEIKKYLNTDKVVFGSERAIKMLRAGKLKKVFMSRNLKQETAEDIRKYSQLSGVKAIALNYPNDELGILCKKPFSISVVGILK